MPIFNNHDRLKIFMFGSRDTPETTLTRFISRDLREIALLARSRPCGTFSAHFGLARGIRPSRTTPRITRLELRKHRRAWLASIPQTEAGACSRWDPAAYARAGTTTAPSRVRTAQGAVFPALPGWRQIQGSNLDRRWGLRRPLCAMDSESGALKSTDGPRP